MVGGGSGGIASARRAAEFGVKVEHNKSGNNSEECFPLSKFVYVKKKRYRIPHFVRIPLLRWDLLREAAWEALASMWDASPRS